MMGTVQAPCASATRNCIHATLTNSINGVVNGAQRLQPRPVAAVDVRDVEVVGGLLAEADGGRHRLAPIAGLQEAKVTSKDTRMVWCGVA